MFAFMRKKSVCVSVQTRSHTIYALLCESDALSRKLVQCGSLVERLWMIAPEILLTEIVREENQDIRGFFFCIQKGNYAQ